MKLTIYDAELQKKEIIYHWLSLLWKSVHNSEGNFVVEFPSSPDMMGRILLGDYITMDEDDSVMMVMSISFDSEEFTVSGRSAEHILALRSSNKVIKPQNAEGAIRGLISEMEPWDMLEMGGAQNTDAETTITVSDGSLLQYFKSIGDNAGISFRIRMGKNENGERRLFLLCREIGTVPVSKYSSFLGNMGGEKYTESDVNYYNVAVVAGEGVGDDRVTVIVGETESEGRNRREIYLDARQIQKEEDETDEEYIERLENYGKQKLSDMKMAKLSSFIISDNSLRPGDLVQVIPSYFGIPFVSVVSSVSIKVQSNKIIRTVEIGQPISTGRR